MIFVPWLNTKMKVLVYLATLASDMNMIMMAILLLLCTLVPAPIFKVDVDLTSEL
jgi:hypothetical protein